MAMLYLIEITVGLVVELSHKVLADRGYRFPGQRGDRDTHLFLCLYADGTNSTWVMLTSQVGRGRYRIPDNLKHGHSRWLRRPTYVCGRETVLEASDWNIQAASETDPAREHQRNSVDMDVVENIRQHLGLVYST